MAGDKVKFNNLERAASSDLNDLQDLQDRTRADFARYLFSGDHYQVAGDNFTVDRGTVLGGLVSTSAGVTSSVFIGPGAISAPLTGASGPLESSNGIGFNRTVVEMPAPTPLSNAYYVLEGRVSEVVTVTTSVSIYDVITKVFGPATKDKQTESQIEFRYREGTINGPPSPVSGWVPIAIVYRPAIGGPINGAFWDCRSLGRKRNLTKDIVDPVVVRRSNITTISKPGSSSPFARVEVDAIDREGNELFAYSGAASDLGTLPKTAGATAAAQFRYLYLTAGEGGAYPVTGVHTDFKHRGVLFLSEQAPNAGFKNPVALALDAGPLRAIGADDAVCVGVVRRNSADTGWDFMRDAGTRRFVFATSSGTGVSLFSGTPAASQLISVVGNVPSNARTVRLRAQWNTAGATVSTVEVRPVGGGPTDFYDRFNIQYDQAGAVEIEVPNEDVSWVSLVGAAIGASILSVQLIGWTI